MHFGLAGATTVNLQVNWPSGAVQTFPNVAADQLYRITEGSGIVPVALGIAPAYQCGPPPLNGATDSGVFIWRDCPSGEWRLKTAAGGSNLTYSGTVTSTRGLHQRRGGRPQLQRFAQLHDRSQDRSCSRSRPSARATDGVNFVPQNGASSCLSIRRRAACRKCTLGRSACWSISPSIWIPSPPVIEVALDGTVAPIPRATVPP